jgi:hypothetical protein
LALAPSASTPGQLLSLDILEGRDAVPAAKRLLKSRSIEGGISIWDASGIFFEMDGLEVSDKPSPRTLVLLYAADLSFRLRWEILPALAEGKCVVAAPYVETGLAFGTVAGLPKKWLGEVFRFAPEANGKFRKNGGPSATLGGATSGFIEFCSSVLSQDLRPMFAAYFDELEKSGASRSI